MYSGKTTRAFVFVQKEEVGKLPPDLLKVATLIPGDPALYQIDLFDWNVSELKTPPNPEYRIFIAQAEILCRYEIPRGGLYVTINERKTIYADTSDTDVLECEEGQLVTIETL
jgi:hypothetical protein